MNSHNQKIQERTLSFAIRIVKLCKFVDEQGGVAKVLANQLIRCSSLLPVQVSGSQLWNPKLTSPKINSELLIPNSELERSDS